MALAITVNLMALAFALPWFMEHKVSSAARRSQQFLLLQGLALILILSANHMPSPIWSSVLALSAFAISMLSIWRLSRALLGWLGPRPKGLHYLLATSCILGTLGFMVLAQSQTGQAAWFFSSFGICLALVGCMALRPHTKVGWLWRYLMFAVGLVMGLILQLRSLFILHPELLQQYTTESSALHSLLSMAPPVGSIMTLLSILLAWHDEARRSLLDKYQEDDLTGLPHRHTLSRQAQGMLRRAQRTSLPLSMVLLDIDRFEQVNHRHGYRVGNEALQLLSLVLQKQMRADEIAARWRGESFCLLIHSDATGVQSLLTRLRSALQLGLQHELQLSISFSSGCVHVPEVWDDLTFEDLSHEAAQALQQAKKSGLGGVKIITLQAPAAKELPVASLP